jgi:uncharacterized protein YdaU (DUF1376 family)
MTTPWISLYPADFLADIGHLGNTELGIYWRLLLVYYRDGKPLPADTDRLRRLAMCFSPEEFRALESVVAEFFRVDSTDDGRRVWRHARADREMAAAEGRHAAASAKASAAAAARWAKAPGNAPSIPPSNASGSAPSNACAMPTTTTTTTTEDRRAKPSALAPSSPAPQAAPARKPTEMQPDEIIFGYGVPLLVQAGTADKQARSFLGKLRKAHGDKAVIDALRQCFKAKPLQPLEWLAKALPPAVPKQTQEQAEQAQRGALVAGMRSKLGFANLDDIVEGNL